MVLLEADLDMKRRVGQLIHPDTELGDRFWHTFYSAYVPSAWVCALCSTEGTKMCDVLT